MSSAIPVLSLPCPSHTLQKHLNMFLSSLEAYEIVPEDERTLYDRKPAAVTNPALRRELKIKQYQKEKDLKSRIEVRYSICLCHCSCWPGHTETQRPKDR